MLKFFQSIFSSTTSDNYPESLIKTAVERAVDGTDPWIRAVPGYKKKLRPAVLRAIDHVLALVNDMAPPLVIRPGIQSGDPLLRSFFISTADMRKILESDPNLANFRGRQQSASPWFYALLIMEKQEKVFLGAELSGDIVLRDVPRTSVSFEAHRLIDPAASEEETRRQLKRRAFDHLLSLALERIAIVKTERDNLERHRALLQAKLNLLQRGGWGFDKPAAEENLDVAGTEASLAGIETQMLELGGDDGMLEVYLGIVADVLSRPEQHLWAGKESLSIDRMGIKRSKTDDADEITLNFIEDSQERNLVVSLVAISADFLQHDDKA